MIVRQMNLGWSVIFHTSHGLLAQNIASRLGEVSELPYWFETQVAIGAHDDLHCVYQKGEREHLTDAGAPCDFTLVPLDDENRVDEMQDRIDEAYRKHTWMGIMQSKHAECLYRNEDTASEMQRMLNREGERRHASLIRLGIDPAIVQKTYDWMHFCDRLSLILCGNDVPAMNRRLEVVTNANGCRFETWQDDQDRIRVEPWPFSTDNFELSVEYRVLEKLSFVDDSALGEALQACQVESRTMPIVAH